ncbi:hypothetical protein ACT3SZ_15440 [Corynebacterium sp. AOP40-9SA-29]|uniref:hypothetical protein n=1 Tax=Corynebacterium sp. AOP40-9SA-29 TaxID=3457677 RepID=UPI0040337D93
MGQRSLLVIGYQTYTQIGVQGGEETDQHRIARHLHWNWGPHMILRAAQVAELMNTTGADEYYKFHASDHALGAAVTFCVNQTTGVTQGLGRYDDESAHSIAEHDNNNGACLLDISPDGEWTLGFLIGAENGGDLATVATAQDYLNASIGSSPKNLRAQGHAAFADKVEHALTVLSEFERGGHAMNQATADKLATPVDRDTTAKALI